MTAFGYFLSSEELGPREMVRYAGLAEQVGFDRVWLSDHYHPWNDAQGQSPFVWAVIGGIAATTRLHVTTAVTCPTVRIHPAVVAQAAATASLMLEGRFTLGVGSGEALNEHILGDRWPSAAERQEMLAEAVEVMRGLWGGEWFSHRGHHYTVENARLYSRPEAPLPVYVSGFGPRSIRLAAQIGDGYINVSPSPDAIQGYREAGGQGPAQGGVKVCWGTDEKDAVRLAHQRWGTSGIPGEAAQELPSPQHFEQVAALVTEDMTAEAVACGPDPERHLRAIRAYVDAGYDEVFIAQIGPDQEGFLRFWEKELRPRLS